MLPKDVKRVRENFQIHDINETIKVTCQPSASLFKDSHCQTECQQTDSRKQLQDGFTQTEQPEENSNHPIVATSIKLLPAVCAFLSSQDPIADDIIRIRWISAVEYMLTGLYRCVALPDANRKKSWDTPLRWCSFGVYSIMLHCQCISVFMMGWLNTVIHNTIAISWS